MDWLQTELRYAALLLSAACMVLLSPSMRDALKGSASPRTGLALGNFLVFGGVLWFQLGYILSGVPDVFHPWNATALVAINAGCVIYIFALGLWRKERHDG